MKYLIKVSFHELIHCIKQPVSISVIASLILRLYFHLFADMNVLLEIMYRVSVMNTAPSCGLPTHCRGGTKFPFARQSEPALPSLVLFGRGTTRWKVLHLW